MKNTLYFILLSFSLTGFSQEDITKEEQTNKGRVYVYWGWNRGYYSNSDIYFKGDDYDFTLEGVQARDRQSPFELNTYFNPAWATIPQYNFRVGYYIKHYYDVSIGIDHMKYVMVANQQVKIDGGINNGGQFDGTYSHKDFNISPDFLKFEHTDGLNYVNIELRRSDKIYEYKKLHLTAIEGLGTGIIYPRTNTYLMDYKRYDEFHLAGYGLAAILGLRVTYNERYFTQFEYKGGFINMPNIRTTHVNTEYASQHFFFSQLNASIGVLIGKHD